MTVLKSEDFVDRFDEDDLDLSDKQIERLREKSQTKRDQELARMRSRTMDNVLKELQNPKIPTNPRKNRK